VHAEACVKLKVTKYAPDIKQLTKEKQEEGPINLVMTQINNNQ